VPMVEAMAALVLCDLALRQRAITPPQRDEA
jgi:chorismate synthase